MRYIFLHFFIILISCNTNKNTVEQTQIGNNLSPENINVKDSSLLLDSLKWIFHSVNFQGVAIFTDTSFKKIKLKTVECDIVLENKIVDNDTTIFLFSFHKNNLQFLYVDDVIFINCFKIYNNIIHPKSNHIVFEFEKDRSSLNKYISLSDSLFSEFLRTDNSNFSPWLKFEVKRRGILK